MLHTFSTIRGLRVIVTVLGFAACRAAFADTNTWVGPSGGSWSNPENWSRGTVPGPDDDVVIPGNSGTILVDKVPVKVKSLVVQDSTSTGFTVLVAPTGQSVWIQAQGAVTIGKGDTVAGGTGYPPGDPDHPNHDGGSVYIESTAGSVTINGTVGGGNAGNGSRGKGGNVTAKGKTGVEVGETGEVRGGTGAGDSSTQAAGKGGDVDISSSSGNVQLYGPTTGGAGGTNTGSGAGGAGGDTKIDIGKGITVGAGANTSGGEGGDGHPKGRKGDSSPWAANGVKLEPGGRLSGNKVVLRTAVNSSVDLSGALPGAIVADSIVCIDGGSADSDIDLRGIPAGNIVITAGQRITIVGHPLLDPGVTLADITSPTAVVSAHPCCGAAAIDFTGIVNDATQGSLCAGWQFAAASDIQVSDLGFFQDPQRVGLAAPHPVGIFDMSGRLLASTTIAPGTASVLDGFFRYEPIPLLTLSAGQMYVVAAVTGSEKYTWQTVGFTQNPNLTFMMDRRVPGNALTFPSSAGTLGGGNGYFGPNFKVATIMAACNPCDANCDGSINAFDIQPFIAQLTATGQPCSACAGDTNDDGSMNLFDIQVFVDCLTGP